MKFEEKLAMSMRRQWEDYYIDYRGLKKLIKRAVERAAAKARDLPEGGESSAAGGALAQALLPRDSLGSSESASEFLAACRMQYNKVGTFYIDELDRGTKLLQTLLPQLEAASPMIRRRWSRERVTPAAAAAAPEESGRGGSLAGSPEKAKKNDKDGGKSRGKARERDSVMRASVELFRNLQHLDNFCILNYTGFVKICKKHDKSVPVPQQLWASVLEAELETLQFVTRSGLDTLLRQLELGYAAAFCEGNLQMAKAALLMRQEKQASSAALTLGLQLGGCVMLLVWTVWDLCIDVDVLGLKIDTHRQWMLASLMLPIYRAGSALVIMTFMWAGCLQCWKVARINYLYMFDLDQDSALSPTSALVLASRFCVVFLLSILLVNKAMLKELPHWLCVAPGIFPASMVLAMMGELLLPLRRLRFAMRSFGRVLVAPCFSVDLWSSFVGDVLTSMVKPMTDMAYSICYLVHGEWLMPYKMQGGCAEWWFFSAVLKPLMCALPLWCRFMQALRVYHDTHKRWPALGNALKYAIAHLVVLFGALHNPLWRAEEVDGDSFVDSSWVKNAWILAYVTSTLYTFAWDVTIDWRLGDRHHGLLRERRMFGRQEWYYLAIGADLILRFGWALTLVPGTQSVGNLLAKEGGYLEVISTVALAWAELCRRAMWAVFRLEAEHLHNTEGLRRVSVIPLHFDPRHEANDAAKAEPVRRCGVLVELLAYAIIVGLLALLAAFTRPHVYYGAPGGSGGPNV